MPGQKDLSLPAVGGICRGRESGGPTMKKLGLAGFAAGLFLILNVGMSHSMTIADSQSDFSGTQGENNWYYGYFSTSADSSSFVSMLYFSDSTWSEATSYPPYTILWSQRRASQRSALRDRALVRSPLGQRSRRYRNDFRKHGRQSIPYNWRWYHRSHLCRWFGSLLETNPGRRY